MHYSLNWREGSVVQNASCSCRRPEFGSQHLQGNSKPCVTPFPVDPVCSCDLQGY